MTTASTRAAASTRAIGVDLGARRVGLAVTAGDTTLAVPLMTLTKERKVSDRIRRLIRLASQHGATTFVVGLPRQMDGAEGASAQGARRFAKALEQRSGMPVALIDERLTSVEAESAMRLAGASAVRRKELIDQMSAVIILQSWLDREARQKREATLEREQDENAP